VAALGGEDRAPAAVDDDDGLAEPGAGGDDGEVAAPERSRLERHQLVLAQRPDAMRRGLQVVQQPHARGVDHGGKPPLVDDPGQVGGHAPAVHHRARDAHTRRRDVCARAGGEKALDDGLERVELAARHGGLAHEHGRAVARLEQREQRLGATGVAGEDHATSGSPRRCP
jgi:hypothetical protein